LHNPFCFLKWQIQQSWGKVRMPVEWLLADCMFFSLSVGQPYGKNCKNRLPCWKTGVTMKNSLIGRWK